MAYHEGMAAQAALEAAVARLVFLTTDRPDFDPIGMASPRLETLLRAAAARTVKGLLSAIACLIDTSPPTSAQTSAPWPDGNRIEPTLREDRNPPTREPVRLSAIPSHRSLDSSGEQTMHRDPSSCVDVDRGSMLIWANVSIAPRWRFHHQENLIKYYPKPR